jgi:hypothetical protein
MTAYRVFPLVVMLVAVPFATGAQLPGTAPDAMKLWPRVPLPPACQEFLAQQREMLTTIENAYKRKVLAEEGCKLFRDLLAAETKLITEIGKHGSTCGAPLDALKQLIQAEGSRFCEAAAQGSRIPLRSSSPYLPKPLSELAAEPPWNPLRSSPREKEWPTGDYFLPGERLPGR